MYHNYYYYYYYYYYETYKYTPSAQRTIPELLKWVAHTTMLQRVTRNFCMRVNCLCEIGTHTAPTGATRHAMCCTYTRNTEAL